MQIKAGKYLTKHGLTVHIEAKTKAGTWWGVIEGRGYDLWNDDGTERFGEIGLNITEEYISFEA